MDNDGSLYKLIIVAGLIFCKSIFVMLEFALVKARITKLEDMKAKNIDTTIEIKIMRSRDLYLNVIQLTISALNLVLGWVGIVIFVRLLDRLTTSFTRTAVLHEVEYILLFVSFGSLIFVNFIFGETVPRFITLQKPEQILILFGKPLDIYYGLTSIFSRFINYCTKKVVQLMGIQKAEMSDILHTGTELRLLVNASVQGGVLNSIESDLIDNVFDFSERTAREVMVPRQDIVCLYTNRSFEENWQKIRESGFTRYPLSSTDKDNITGIVHLRDLLWVLRDNYDLTSAALDEIKRPVPIVPAGMSVANILQNMQREHAQLSIVADEYGGTAGLVTMEDLLEEIVGDIQDEHDHEESSVVKCADGDYEFNGLMLMEEVAEILGIEVSERDEDTVGGYVFGLLGRKPKLNDRVEISNYEFVIKQTRGFRVVRVRARKKNIESKVIET